MPHKHTKGGGPDDLVYMVGSLPFTPDAAELVCCSVLQCASLFCNGVWEYIVVCSRLLQLVASCCPGL